MSEVYWCPQEHVGEIKKNMAVVKIKTIISGTEQILYVDIKHIEEPRWHWKQIYKLLIHNTDYKTRILLGQQ